jgi:hypothetical protein
MLAAEVYFLIEEDRIVKSIYSSYTTLTLILEGICALYSGIENMG